MRGRRVRHGLRGAEPERVNTLTLTITPIDFHADTVEDRLGHGFINIWTRSLSPEDVDRLIDANGNLPGEFMGAIFNQMSPMRSLLKYNLDLLEIVDDEQRLMNWLRMEKWIADRPDHPGEAAKQWMKDLYQQNKLVRNEWKLDGRRVDLRNIRMPVLNVYAKDDHIIPPATSRALSPMLDPPTTRNWHFRAAMSVCSLVAVRRRCSLPPSVRL